MGDELWELVRDAMHQRDQMETLLGEMVATLALPANQAWIPEVLKEFAGRWKERFNDIEKGKT